jgi:hypothetical protein
MLPTTLLREPCRLARIEVGAGCLSRSLSNSHRDLLACGGICIRATEGLNIRLALHVAPLCRAKPRAPANFLHAFVGALGDGSWCFCCGFFVSRFAWPLNRYQLHLSWHRWLKTASA